MRCCFALSAAEFTAVTIIDVLSYGQIAGEAVAGRPASRYLAVTAT